MIDLGSSDDLTVADRLVVGEAVPALARLALRLVVAYVVFSRLVQDIYTLPVGASLHITDLVLGVLLVVWALWMITAPRPFPIGMVGVLGSALLVVVLVAPFLNAGAMTPFELNGAERGLVRAILYTGLFLATYHLASWRPLATRIITAVVCMTVVQAVIATYEAVAKSRIQLLGVIWQTIGFEVDPRGSRGEEIALDARLTGELRAQATAPHSLVLAGLLVLGIGVCAVRYLHSDSARSRRRYLAAILVQLLGLGATNQRTGFLALAAVIILLGVAQVRRLPSAIPLFIAGIVGAGAVSVLSPNTPRLVLNFFTGQTTDHNVTVRISKYALLPELVGRRPVIGAGYLTGDPSIVIFDNAYLTQLVELGILGLTLLLGFLLVVGARSFSKYLEAPRDDQPLLVAAMCAAVTLLVTMATFDVLSFGQLFPTCLIVLAIGAARADALSRAGRPPQSAPTLRRWRPRTLGN